MWLLPCLWLCGRRRWARTPAQSACGSPIAGGVRLALAAAALAAQVNSTAAAANGTANGNATCQVNTQGNSYEIDASGYGSIAFKGVKPRVRYVRSNTATRTRVFVSNFSTYAIVQEATSRTLEAKLVTCPGPNTTASPSQEPSPADSGSRRARLLTPLLGLMATFLAQGTNKPVLPERRTVTWRRKHGADFVWALLVTIALSAALCVLSATPGAHADVSAEQCEEAMDVVVVVPECSVCVVGATPWAYRQTQRWNDTVREMAMQCEILVHIGDTMGGTPREENNVCKETLMAGPIAAMARSGKPVLYTPGATEMSHCHRVASLMNPLTADFLMAKDARSFLIDRFFQNTSTDVSGTVPVRTQSEECPFNSYIETCSSAVSTYEVPGAQWYLLDEREKYPLQETVDPIADRKQMYDRSKNCAISWLEESFQRANASGVKVLFLCYNAAFWDQRILWHGSLGERVNTYKFEGPIWNNDTLGHAPYQPFADKLLELVDKYSDLMVYSVSAEWRMWHIQSLLNKKNYVYVMTEGGSKGVETFVRFIVNPDKYFDPVTVQRVHVPPVEIRQWGNSSNQSSMSNSST